jgi:phosphoribosyl 1,2-cyclic phosphate phosphodiesterase
VTLETIRRCFSYAFHSGESQNSIPRLETIELDGAPVSLFGLDIIPVPLMHGRDAIFGFRAGRMAYLTDHSEIPETSLPLLADLDVLFLDALRHKPHPTHSTVEQSLKYVELIQPKRAYFTHLCHDLGHARTEQLLPEHVRLAFDGLELTIESEAAA